MLLPSSDNIVYTDVNIEEEKFKHRAEVIGIFFL